MFEDVTYVVESACREVNVAAWLADSGRRTADLTDRVAQRADNDHRL